MRISDWSSDVCSSDLVGIDTYQEPVIYMRSDCHICKSEGFEARSRVEVRLGGRRIIATLNVVSSAIIAPDEAGLRSEERRVGKEGVSTCGSRWSPYP